MANVEDTGASGNETSWSSDYQKHHHDVPAAQSHSNDFLSDRNTTIVDTNLISDTKFVLDTNAERDHEDDNEEEENDGDDTKEKEKETIKIKRRSAAQISECLQMEITSGVILDQDCIMWNPNDGLPHSGKWPIEEERFAYMLINKFENGVLDDCEEGTTLRSYLAKTLRCAPMRVSKKFAGKCVGSKAYEHSGEHFQIKSATLIAPTEQLSLCLNGFSQPKGLVRNDMPPAPPKYSLRERVNRSYDEYDCDESSSTSGEDLNDASSGSSSDSGTSDIQSPTNRRKRLTNRSSCTRRRSQNALRQRAEDLFVVPDYDPTEITDLNHVSDEYDEWREALQYFCTTESGAMKRTHSAAFLCND